MNKITKARLIVRVEKVGDGSLGLANIFFKLSEANLVIGRIECKPLENNPLVIILEIYIAEVGNKEDNVYGGLRVNKGWNHLPHLFEFSNDEPGSELRVFIRGTGVGNGSSGTVKTNPRP